jgi:hypothetical protein
MNKQINRILLTILLTIGLFIVGTTNTFSIQSNNSKVKKSNKLVVSNIKDESILTGCGCYFSYPSEDKKRVPRYVFSSDLDEKSAWMNIDGKDITLKLVNSTNPKGKKKLEAV